jgi:hypothetical protein
VTARRSVVPLRRLPGRSHYGTHDGWLTIRRIPPDYLGRCWWVTDTTGAGTFNGRPEIVCFTLPEARMAVFGAYARAGRLVPGGVPGR